MHAATPIVVTTALPRDLAALAGKYLTFALAGEEYGLPVLRVREIIKMLAITAVPQAPPHVKGVINLRGKVIPIVDLRVRLGCASSAYEERTCIIVAEVTIRRTAVMMGLVVDAVAEVLTVGLDELQATPAVAEAGELDYITAAARVKGRVMFLLDLDRLIGDAD